MWTTQQRQALVFLLVVMLGSYAMVYVMNPVRLNNPQDGAPSTQLADRVDPNTADVATLSILPGLGRKRAEEIIAFRQREQARHPGAIVFEEAADLSRVRGIGPATIENLVPFLIFPATTRPATAPAGL